MCKSSLFSGVSVLASAAFAAAVFGSTTAQAAVIYSETFDNGSGANQLLSYDGNGAAPGGGTWRNYYGGTNTRVGAGGVGNLTQFNVNSGSGSPGSTPNGRLTVDGFNWPDQPFVFDAAPTFLESGAYLSVGNLTTADFWVRVGASRTNKFALQIGSQWYVTDANYTSPNDTTWANPVVDIQTANWRTFQVNPTSYTVGATAQTLSAHGASGSLSSVGVLGGNLNDAFWRIDTVTVNSVIPEPASLSALGLLGIGLLTRRRSR